MDGNSDWLVEDSEDEAPFLPDVSHELQSLLGRDTDDQLPPEPSTIQTATFSPRQPRPSERAHPSADVSNVSLSIPPGEPSSSNVTGHPSPDLVHSTDVLPKPKPRPKPRIKMKTTTDASTNPNDSIQAGTLTSHISDASASWANRSTGDSIQPVTATFPDVSSMIEDVYSSFDIAERAKMRSRKSRSSKKPIYTVPDDVIELTSDEDELNLKSTKRQKKQGKAAAPTKPKPKPRVKAKAVKRLSPDSEGAATANIQTAQEICDSSSQAPASTMPTNPPTTPPQPHESPPPVTSARKRKRKPLSILTDEEMETDQGPPEAPSLTTREPPPFFASPSPSIPIPNSGTDIPQPREEVIEGQRTGTGKKATQRKNKNKGKARKRSEDEPNESTDMPHDLPVSIAPSADADAEARGALANHSSDVSKSDEPPAKPSTRKGKGKAIMSDEDEPISALITSPPQSHQPQTASAPSPVVEQSTQPPSKESLHPRKPKPPDHVPATPVVPLLSRATSVKPKVTTMSELIRRVNSQPSSPFPNTNGAYSPLLKSSRMMLSRIAPLHPNRRTPPPPLPRPPPPKKSKKQIELEERIEEELAETVEGWSCMATFVYSTVSVNAQLYVKTGGCVNCAQLQYPHTSSVEPIHRHLWKHTMALPQLMNAFDTLKEQAKDAIWALSSCICQQSARVKINGRTFNLVKVLGEGGFSFVYLAQDEASGRQFALKKIRCPTGSEGVKEAMREVEAYRRFRHPNIIRILDSAVVQDPEGEGQIVYLFLPLYKRGNVQDAINSNVVNGRHFSEKEMIRIFKGTCEAVRAMHDYHTTSASEMQPQTLPARNGAGSSSQPGMSAEHHSDDEDGDELLPHPEGDGDGGYSYKSSVNVPLVTKRRIEEGDTVFDGDEDLPKGQPPNGSATGKDVHVPYAHRDIKPGNVMLADDGTPILMDFGSAVKARIAIETRSQALLQQDIAAEQSTMAYRAPELFDVKTGITLDEKVDIWSLGCTLYAMAYSHSPFENTQTTEQGGSIAMAVLNAQYKHPSSAYSQGLRELIDRLLKVNPKDRPDIHRVIQATDGLLQSLA
ncbi:hypothetical protein ID866_6066 [Astraeus odoratus]|nr:hypothetical protein ID866_6066 [Astraeus odoratus]